MSTENVPARHTAITKSSVCHEPRAAPTKHGTENHRPRAGAAASLVTGNQAEATMTSPWPRGSPPRVLGGHPHSPGMKPTQGAWESPRAGPHPPLFRAGTSWVWGPLALPICIPRDRSWDSLSQGAHWTQVRVQSALLSSLHLQSAACGGHWRESTLGPQGYGQHSGLGCTAGTIEMGAPSEAKPGFLWGL